MNHLMNAVKNAAPINYVTLSNVTLHLVEIVAPNPSKDSRSFALRFRTEETADKQVLLGQEQQTTDGQVASANGISYPQLTGRAVSRTYVSAQSASYVTMYLTPDLGKFYNLQYDQASVGILSLTETAESLSEQELAHRQQISHDANNLFRTFKVGDSYKAMRLMSDAFEDTIDVLGLNGTPAKKFRYSKGLLAFRVGAIPHFMEMVNIAQVTNLAGNARFALNDVTHSFANEGEAVPRNYFEREDLTLFMATGIVSFNTVMDMSLERASEQFTTAEVLQIDKELTGANQGHHTLENFIKGIQEGRFVGTIGRKNKYLAPGSRTLPGYMPEKKMSNVGLGALNTAYGAQQQSQYPAVNFQQPNPNLGVAGQYQQLANNINQQQTQQQVPNQQVPQQQGQQFAPVGQAPVQGDQGLQATNPPAQQQNMVSTVFG